ncbi:DUF1003 domain-containing protein [Fructilactobacillus vespulae]|uniref:DUF1003 domain-containing protein n=1 Tax=Fructilactobacillus vespulae TaxID=1249630 RepID=UPI0039B530C4
MANRVIKKCKIDGKSFPAHEGKLFKNIASPVRKLIRLKHPEVKNTDFICNRDVLFYEIQHVNNLIQNDNKRNSKLDRRLTKTMDDANFEITDVNDIMKNSLTFGQRVSDGVARFGGSWTFIFIFTGILVVWMILNTVELFGIHFDRFPFILLNLFLSCVAAIQAPIIMMSQNRSADLDRMNAENDYHVNQKSEQELRILHAKLDLLSREQVPHNIDIARIQMRMIGELQREIMGLREDISELKEKSKSE